MALPRKYKLQFWDDWMWFDVQHELYTWSHVWKSYIYHSHPFDGSGNPHRILELQTDGSWRVITMTFQNMETQPKELLDYTLNQFLAIKPGL